MIIIEKLISSNEHSKLEVKKVSGGIPDSLWESYSAFANTNGGVILLGVSEVGTELIITGVSEAQNKIKLLWNCLNNRQKVSLNILLEHQIYVHNVDGKEVIVIEVPRADRRDKPIYINNDLQRGTYRRNAAGDYHCSLPEIKAMLRDQLDVSPDSRVVEEVLLNDLNKETIAGYRSHFASLKPVHVWNSLDDETFLHKIGAAGRSASGALKPTLAGLLMFGTAKIIAQILPDYFLDYREINDSRRWSERVVSNQDEWSGNIFDFFFKIVNKLTADIKSPFCTRNRLEREDDTVVHKAIREALTNALIHADYYGRQGIVIEKRPQKIIFANPGIFRPDKDEVFDGCISDPRNPNIFKMFALINIGAQAGCSLFNMRTIWQKTGWPDPVWEEKFPLDRLILSVPVEIGEERGERGEIGKTGEIGKIGETGEEGKIGEKEEEGKIGEKEEEGSWREDEKVTKKVPVNKKINKSIPGIFPDNEGVDEDILLKVFKNGDFAKKVPEKITKNQELILSNIIQNHHITIPVLASIVGISERKIKENIAKLKVKGLLERVGPDKGGYWKAL